VSLTLRPATTADLAILADITIDSAFDGKPPDGFATAYLDHELATGAGIVAAEDGRPVGFGILLTRGDISNLAELFVRRGTQSRGVGAAILARLFEGARPRRFTVASSDPRALALYARHGMVPRWPDWDLRAEAKALDLPAGDVATVEAAWGDAAWADWDRRCAGRPRVSEHGYLRDACAGVPLLFRKGGATVGYACVRTAGHIGAGDSAVIGPLGARDTGVAPAVALAAARWAAERRAIVLIDLPGPHAACASLIRAGFRIDGQGTYMSNMPTDFMDPACYAPIGAEFF
jgi:GNAT superfamily N-acetyltransferase